MSRLEIILLRSAAIFSGLSTPVASASVDTNKGSPNPNHTRATMTKSKPTTGNPSAVKRYVNLCRLLNAKRVDEEQPPRTRWDSSAGWHGERQVEEGSRGLGQHPWRPYGSLPQRPSAALRDVLQAHRPLQQGEQSYEVTRPPRNADRSTRTRLVDVSSTHGIPYPTHSRFLGTTSPFIVHLSALSDRVRSDSGTVQLYPMRINFEDQCSTVSDLVDVPEHHDSNHQRTRTYRDLYLSLYS